MLLTGVCIGQCNFAGTENAAVEVDKNVQRFTKLARRGGHKDNATEGVECTLIVTLHKQKKWDHQHKGNLQRQVIWKYHSEKG